jgi:hypothetical protein
LKALHDAWAIVVGVRPPDAEAVDDIPELKLKSGKE